MTSPLLWSRFQFQQITDYTHTISALVTPMGLLDIHSVEYRFHKLEELSRIMFSKQPV